ncbi:hypothetical protein [Streptomyces sp. NPDC088719]|uniref:hypothetical protein n=1 Tax=Streptomyces sp. NPDC088719 TaxID=3365872 RepID=UPI003814FB3D
MTTKNSDDQPIMDMQTLVFVLSSAGLIVPSTLTPSTWGTVVLVLVVVLVLTTADAWLRRPRACQLCS